MRCTSGRQVHTNMCLFVGCHIRKPDPTNEDSWIAYQSLLPADADSNLERFFQPDKRLFVTSTQRSRGEE
jgi:hypothetical protein